MLLKSFTKLISAGALVLGLASCGGEDDSQSAFFGADLSDVFAYKSDGRYRDSLKRCVTADEANEYCPLGFLPILGSETENVTVENIMDRVIVSHDWMGQRFEEVLNALPEDMLPLFRPITAIVIDDDIRPAFYTTSTGAIYLDPAFFWLSIEEKQTVSQRQDFRSGFDDPLAFRQLGRYVIGNTDAYSFGSLSNDSTRELDDILLLVANLLLHELAHANDFFPPDTYGLLNPDFQVFEAALTNDENWISAKLNRQFPKVSDQMYSLAEVMYLGRTPSIDDLEITAEEVGQAFEPDGAADDYGYSSEFEDVAMLFEAVMMKYLFDADYDIAFTDVPETTTSCGFFNVRWGVRNRIGDASVIDRAHLVASEVLPHIDFSTFFAELDLPSELPNDTWCLFKGKTDQPVPHEHMQRPYL